MSKQVSKTRKELLQASSRSFAASRPTPFWLKRGDYDSSEWEVVDDLVSSPKPAVRIRWKVQVFDPRRTGETSWLTDPAYSNLLDTIKCQSFNLRSGKYSVVTAAATHGHASRFLIKWAVWMIGNGIYQFSDLGPDDFESYAAAIPYGPGFLLEFAPRLIQYIEKLEASGMELPTVKRARQGLPDLGTWDILQAAGIDPYLARTDDPTTYELAKLTSKHGFHLTEGQTQRLVKGDLRPQRHCRAQIFQALQPWHDQWIMRSHLPADKIGFNPFANKSISRMSVELGVPQGRTRTPPIPQTMELIDKSIRWVLDYAPVLLDLRDQYLDVTESGVGAQRSRHLLARIIADTIIPDGPGRPFPLNPSNKRVVAKPGVEFGVAINRYIPTACAIVICAFTARRHNEVLTLRATGPNGERCISHDENGLWIETFIEKTTRDWVKTPCNELTKAAVTILERWSEPARSISGRPGLFQLRRLTCKPVVRFHLYDTIKDFASFLSLPPLADGSEWEFLPHQLRRFFAIMYFWRYEYRNLAALSYHLRHLDPVMTQIYVTEVEAGAIFREVGKDHTAILLTKTAMGARNLSGSFGERFKSIVVKLYRRYSRSTRVIAPKMVRRVVERYVNKSGRRLKGMLWGYCACGSRRQDLETARCLTHDPKKNFGGPDFGNSSPTVCCTCPHHVTEKLFEPFLLNEMAFHERVAADSRNGPILRATSHEHAMTLRAHCKRSFEDSKPVEVLNVGSR